VMVDNMVESLSKADPQFNRETAEIAKEYFRTFEEDYTKYIVQLTQQFKKPVFGVSILTDSLSKTLYPLEGYNYKGVYFPSPERAVKALCGMVQYGNWLKAHKADHE
jgi:O-succinylbenzoate synthase